MKNIPIGDFSYINFSESSIIFRQGRSSVTIIILFFLSVLIIIGSLLIGLNENILGLAGIFTILPIIFILLSYIEYHFDLNQLEVSKKITFQDRTILKLKKSHLSSLIFTIDIKESYGGEAGGVTIHLLQCSQQILTFNSVSTADDFYSIINKSNTEMKVEKSNRFKNNIVLNIIR